MTADKVWTIRELLAWCEGYLAEHGDAHPRLSAQWLLCDATGLERIQLYTEYDKPLSQDERAHLRATLKRRGAGEPLQYITGTAAFRFVTLDVRPGVLIPRPETEVLVSHVLEHLATCGVEEPSVCEVGTGSGCIALSIASECETAHVVATDISPDAVALATQNAAKLGVAERVTVLECDLGEGVPGESLGTFDAVVSNPPYIPTVVLQSLDAEVRDHEPALALDGGEDGLDVYRRLLPFAIAALKPGGLFACELHETCLEQACDLARAAGFATATYECDLAGKPRFVLAMKGE